jgi:LysR family transcriptional regulator, regulator of peptidoglycan recycling
MPTPGFAETSAFVAVVEQKSFTKAAKQLALSPPRVSELVRQLEERLGVRLIERTTRSVAATAAGDRLIERLRPVLEEYAAAFEATNEFRSKPAGLLRLTVAPPAADFVLAPVIPRFLALYPEISLDISVDGALTDIVAGRFDAGIRPGERVARDMIAVRVSDEMPFVVAAAPAYLAHRGEPKTPRELAAHACIRVRLPSGGFFPWRFRINRRIVEIQVEGPLIANGSATIPLTAAIEGLGLIQLPLPYVAGELSTGRLVAVLDQWAPPPSEGFFLYYPSRHHTRAALKALVDFLRDARRDAEKRSTGTEPSVRPLAL